MISMISWVWRSKLSPLYHILKMFGVNTRKYLEEDELSFQAQVCLTNGWSKKKLQDNYLKLVKSLDKDIDVRECKQQFEEVFEVWRSNSWYVPTLVLNDLSASDAIKVREFCQDGKNGLKMAYDQHKDWLDSVEYEKKKAIFKARTREKVMEDLMADEEFMHEVGYDPSRDPEVRKIELVERYIVDEEY